MSTFPDDDVVAPTPESQNTGVAEPQPLQPAPAAPTTVTTTRAKRRAARIAIVALSVITAAALALGTYFWYAADRWHDDSVAWQAKAHSHASDVSNLQTQLNTAETNLADAKASLEESNAQLTTATDRITSLANEKAQAGDQAATNQQLLDYQKSVSTAASEVSSSLEACIAGQTQLIDALKDPGRYTDTSVAAFTTQLNTLCQRAKDANTQLQRQVNQ
ncbi:MAG: hypothetical protein LBH13_08565 [Cellulomonadaceae bacterium]|jgi:uncharacterized coiled-coil protein SlyX|nr:hypothetical protein [Cellulomonadaceae bacterium]